MSSILPPTNPQKIPKRPPHKRAIIEPKKVTVRAVLPPNIVLVKTSLPKLSVPNQNSNDGACNINEELIDL